MRLGVLGAAFSLALVLVAATAAQPEARAPVRLSGTTTLAAVNVQQRCNFGGGSSVLIAACSQVGAFAGKPARAGAAYSWRWDLEVGSNGVTTGFADERGELALNFGSKLGILRVTTTGRQEPVGPQEANHAKGLTTGTWKFKSGTKKFAKRRGSGTYRFQTERTGPDTFQVARIVVQGTLR